MDRRVAQLESISKPVTEQEAAALVTCFGPDDCYGVAWTLLHLIETSPHQVLKTKPALDANEWHHRLYDGALFEEPNARVAHPALLRARSAWAARIVGVLKSGYASATQGRLDWRHVLPRTSTHVPPCDADRRADQ